MFRKKNLTIMIPPKTECIAKCRRAYATDMNSAPLYNRKAGLFANVSSCDSDVTDTKELVKGFKSPLK